jgi:hypothetical protein
MKVSMKKLFLYAAIKFSSESEYNEESGDNTQPLKSSWKENYKKK